MTDTPPPANEPISGRLSSLKPWQFVVIGGVVVLFIALIPTINRLATKQKKHEISAAVIAAGGSGEKWHPPPSYPNPIQQVAARPTPPPVVRTPQAPQSPPAVVGATRTAAASSNGPDDLRMFGQRSAPPPPPPPGQQGSPGTSGNPSVQNASAQGDSLGGMLKPTELSGYRATRMQKPWATIEQGRIIACNSVTPMTSSLPGFVKAKVTYDVMSADGTTVLIDRNSDIFGEIAHGLVQGQDRLFVLWRQITTPAPDFVRITLNSPAADELGEAGLPGDINHHTWQRIGGALMLSGIDALLQGASAGISAALSNQRSENSFGGGQLNFYQFQGQGQSLASSLLQHQIAIPDTLHRDQALPCSIFVSGDLDFSGVYKLRVRGH